MTKEDILSHVVPKDCWWEEARNFTNLPERYVHKAMDLYAKREAIGFLKWYGVKVAGLVEYIKDIRPSVTSGEIEEKIKEFEGKTIDELYSLYQQSKSKQP